MVRNAQSLRVSLSCTIHLTLETWIPEFKECPLWKLQVDSLLPLDDPFQPQLRELALIDPADSPLHNL